MTDTPDTSPEAVEWVKAEAMTLEAHGTLWVSADDYATLAAERDALKARAESAEAAIDAAPKRLDASLFTNAEHQQAKDILRAVKEGKE